MQQKSWENVYHEMLRNKVFNMASKDAYYYAKVNLMSLKTKAKMIEFLDNMIVLHDKNLKEANDMLDKLVKERLKNWEEQKHE